jgi:hypothetical protein
MARILAQNAFEYAITHPYYLVLLLALKVMVPGFVAAPALEAARRSPLTFG